MRTAHLERLRDLSPGDLFYIRTSYDFDPSAAPRGSTVVRLNRLHLLGRLARSGYAIVELNEPIGVATWPDVLLQVATIRLKDMFKRRRTTIVAYCIELVDPAEALASKFHLPLSATRCLSDLLMRRLVRSFDRLAFGTKGALTAYERYLNRATLEARTQLFEALPSPCSCISPGEGVSTARPMQVAFVGRFDERKGIQQLIDAWDAVRILAGDANLRLLGKGPLLDQVRAFASTRPEVSLDVDPPREVIHDVLRQSRVLVLLSQPLPHWREQIGLPILEGLAHGCTVVASSETGIADWLAEHGHVVLDAACSSKEFAVAIAHSVSAGKQRLDVVAALPPDDQRVAADSWMMASSSSQRRG